MEAQEVVSNLVKLFHNNYVREQELQHMISWIESELKNPTPVEGKSIEEKLAFLTQSKEEILLKKKEFDEIKKQKMEEIKVIIDRIDPELYRYAQASFITKQMMGMI